MRGIAEGSAKGLELPVAYWLAAGCLGAFLVFLWIICGTKTYLDAGPQVDADPPQPGEGQHTNKIRHFWYIILGADDRVSTSKVQLALWTLALSYALLVIIFRNAGYPAGALDARYLLLLGFPAGAVTSAKAITTGQMASGAISKKRAPSPRKPLTKAVTEIVTNDKGDLDLGDAQYFIFNLIALTAFFVAFAHHPVKLPVLSDTLVGLTSASAGAYVAKKAARPARAKITAVAPEQGEENAATKIRIFGSGFSAESGTGLRKPVVTVGGLVADVKSSSDTEVTALVSQDLVPGKYDVQVVTPDGQAARHPAAFDVRPSRGNRDQPGNG